MNKYTLSPAQIEQIQKILAKYSIKMLSGAIIMIVPLF